MASTAVPPYIIVKAKQLMEGFALRCIEHLLAGTSVGFTDNG
jgi:hypothetical protein